MQDVPEAPEVGASLARADLLRDRLIQVLRNPGRISGFRRARAFPSWPASPRAQRQIRHKVGAAVFQLSPTMPSTTQRPPRANKRVVPPDWRSELWTAPGNECGWFRARGAPTVRLTLFVYRVAYERRLR